MASCSVETKQLLYVFLIICHPIVSEAEQACSEKLFFIFLIPEKLKETYVSHHSTVLRKLIRRVVDKTLLFDIMNFYSRKLSL